MRQMICGLSVLLLAAMMGAQSKSSSPDITVRNLTLNGATQISAEDKNQIADEVRKQTYTNRTLPLISSQVLDGFQQRGFFKASADPAQITVVSSAVAQEVIDVAFNVHEGQRYHLKEITFTNNNVVPAAQLRAAFPIADGDIFDTAKTRRGLLMLRNLYIRRGYINCTPVPEILVNDPAGLITLSVNVDEGAAYRMGALTLDGVEPVPGAGVKLQQAWKQYQGQVYDDQMMSKFIAENAAYLPPHTSDVQLYRIVQDNDNHLLNFRLELGDTPAKK